MFKNKSFKKSISRVSAKNLAVFGVVVAMSCLLSESVLADFDIDRSVTAMLDPLAAAIDEHWAKVVAISGIGAAVLGEGDMRQRAIRAASGTVISSFVVMALLAML